MENEFLGRLRPPLSRYNRRRAVRIDRDGESQLSARLGVRLVRRGPLDFRRMVPASGHHYGEGDLMPLSHCGRAAGT